MSKDSSEIDREVAEKVMGWRQGRIFWLDSEGHALRMTVQTWSPSTRIDHAWEVVDAVWAILPKTGHGTYRFMLNRIDPDGSYRCRFAPDPDGDWRTQVEGHADTAPLAICRAALAAVKPQ